MKSSYLNLVLIDQLPQDEYFLIQLYQDYLIINLFYHLFVFLILFLFIVIISVLITFFLNIITFLPIIQYYQIYFLLLLPTHISISIIFSIISIMQSFYFFILLIQHIYCYSSNYFILVSCSHVSITHSIFSNQQFIQVVLCIKVNLLFFHNLHNVMQMNFWTNYLLYYQNIEVTKIIFLIHQNKQFVMLVCWYRKLVVNDYYLQLKFFKEAFIIDMIHILYFNHFYCIYLNVHPHLFNVPAQILMIFFDFYQILIYYFILFNWNQYNNYFLVLFFYNCQMITETQVQVDYHKVYQELNLFVNASHENLERTFHRRQNMLIKQLQQRANQLKEDISKLKKLTSEQTIQGMIIKKKQEMEAQRMKLQTNWRQLTEKLKKLEQQQKKLRNQNSEALFDISNLEMKIQQLTNVNCQLQNNLKNIKQEIKKSTFVSLPDKKPYQSPYKYLKIQENINQKQNQKINNEQNITKRLNQIKQIKKVPNQVLIQLLNKRDIKSQLFDLLHS